MLDIQNLRHVYSDQFSLSLLKQLQAHYLVYVNTCGSME